MACTSCGIAFNTGSADICPTNPCPSLEVAARVPAHEDFVRSGLLRQLLCNLALECLSCSGAAQPARQQVPLLLSFTFLHLPSLHLEPIPSVLRVAASRSALEGSDPQAVTAPHCSHLLTMTGSAACSRFFLSSAFQVRLRPRARRQQRRNADTRPAS